MKNFYFVILLIIASLSGVYSQTLVSTQVQKKNVVLEEFTGIHCGYCPEGHAIAQQLLDDNPGKAVVIAIHTGGFATPGTGEPDFRTPFGDAIASQSNLTGYPAGTVNRHLFSDLASNGGTAMGRGGWITAASRIFPEDSPVNVGASTSFNATTRELTVNVELYYTSNSATSSNFINVALLQSNILGPQSGGGAGNNYVHKHMLRHLITGQWGDEITTTSTGTFVQKTYTYTVPTDYIGVDCVIEDCSVAVFVSESHQEILSGADVPAIDGTTLVVASLTEPSNTVLNPAESTTATFNMNITNKLATDEDFLFTLTKDDELTGWGSSFSLNGSTYNTSTTETLTAGVQTPITIDVTTNTNSGFVKYTLTVKSISNPNAPEIIQNVYVISNVKTLLVNNQGAWSTGTPSDLASDYIDAFINANVTQYTQCDYKKFMLAGTQNKLSDVDNIFFNIGWTFPGFTNENVAFFSSFLDGGGNLFVAGQDVGWDTWASQGNGTIETKAFYTNYLNADYQADGSPSNNTINSNGDDDVFGTVGTSSIVNIYGGSNMYPDEIAAIGNGQTIFYYNTGTTKSAGVKSSNGTYKTVYLGFDPSMVSNVDVRNDIIRKTYNWFEGIVSVEEIDNNISIYPNPASEFIMASVPANSKIDIFDLTGKIILSEIIINKNQKVNINKLKPGIYIIKANTGNKIMNSKFIVK